MSLRHAVRSLVFAAAIAGAAVPGLAQDDPPAAPQHDHGGAAERPDTASGELPPFIPPLTDEDRRAAFPDLDGHTVHDEALHYFVLVDGIEWGGAGDGALAVNAQGWIGGDSDRFWFRASGEGAGDGVDHAGAELFYGTQIGRWWDIVAGIRQDVRPGVPRTWAAIGVQGLAPQWFELAATAYVGASARTYFRVEAEYELLLTNRLVLQPRLEAGIAGASDVERGIGAGLGSTEAGLRLRYEIRREVAPYVGVTWSGRWGRTAELAEAAGEESSAARVLAGLRMWF